MRDPQLQHRAGKDPGRSLNHEGNSPGCAYAQGQLERDVRDPEERRVRDPQLQHRAGKDPGRSPNPRAESPGSACAQGQLERDVRDPEERRVRELQAQRGAPALAERFLILHASKLVALMMFCAAMAQPGAIGWLLLGTKPPGCSPQRTAAQASL